MVLPLATSTAPSVYSTHPPQSLLQFSPFSNPPILSPPISDRTLARPFTISHEVYSNALHPAVPVSVAIIYATTVVYFNSWNKERHYKPWSFSKTNAFWFLALSHNILLALYSGWTFVGMFNAIKETWPGFGGEHGLAGAVDALCKINGPRGLGSAVRYDAGSSGWSVTDTAIKLIEGLPDTTDVGRLWNEGLAFYGWLFYLSKLYEVVDTFIVLAKGKRSSTLQTFHHTGAILCVWAGIRYMSPPIWMFVFINSGLHTLMYTYYTLTSLTIQVPKEMKQTLTTLQIIQIIFGGGYAIAHLFIAYDIPIERSYIFVHNLSTALPSTASSITSAVSSAFNSVATAGLGSAGFGSWMKKAALRAAGEEGLAENVRNYQGDTFGIDAVHAAQVEKANEEIRYRMDIERIHCLDTPGQVFAILLNAIYLAPLAGLFIRFFYKSYISRIYSDPPKPTQQQAVKESSSDAVKEVEREIREAIASDQGSSKTPPPELQAKLEKAKKDTNENVSHVANNASDKAHDLGNKIKESAGDLPEKAQKSAQDLADKGKDIAGDFPDGIQKASESMGAQAKKLAKDSKDSVAEDLLALRERMKNLGRDGIKAKSESNEAQKSKPTQEDGIKTRSEGSKAQNSKPLQKNDSKGDGDKVATKNRNKSPVKTDKPRGKSPVKRPQSAKGLKDEQDEKEFEEKAGQHIDDNKHPEEEKGADEKPVEPATEDAQEPEEEKNADEKQSPDLSIMAQSYEVVPDEPKTEEERKAEEEMQPQQE